MDIVCLFCVNYYSIFSGKKEAETSNGILSVGINALRVIFAADDDVDVAYHMDIDTILKIKKKPKAKETRTAAHEKRRQQICVCINAEFFLKPVN